MEQARYTRKAVDVYLFATCLIDMFVPQAGLDSITLLEREGLRVHYPRKQSCCGQPAYSHGNPEQARAVVRAQLDLFPEDWPIIVPSGSCAGMMRHHWPLLFTDDAVAADKAAALAQRVYELSEYLLLVLNLQFPEVTEAPTENFALHTSCAARREMGTRMHGTQLLERLTGVKRIEHLRESECCGFGGTFSLNHPDISGAMVKDKVAALCATGCQRVVSADCGCLLNIGHAADFQAAGLKVEHISSFILRHSLADKEST